MHCAPRADNLACRNRSCSKCLTRDNVGPIVLTAASTTSMFELAIPPPIPNETSVNHVSCKIVPAKALTCPASIRGPCQCKYSECDSFIINASRACCLNVSQGTTECKEHRASYVAKKPAAPFSCVGSKETAFSSESKSGLASILGLALVGHMEQTRLIDSTICLTNIPALG